MPSLTIPSLCLAGCLVALATDAAASTLVANKDGSWTVKAADGYAPPAQDAKFQAKSNADNAQKYLGDMEKAAEAGDKTAYDHAVSNLKAAVEIAQKKYSQTLQANWIPVFQKITEDVYKEIGEPPDLGDYLVLKDGKITPESSAKWDKVNGEHQAKYNAAYEARREKWLQSPEGKAAMAPVNAAQADYNALDLIRVTYETAIWDAAQKKREAAPKTATGTQTGAPKTCGEITDPQMARDMGCVVDPNAPPAVIATGARPSPRTPARSNADCATDPVCARELREAEEREANDANGTAMTPNGAMPGSMPGGYPSSPGTMGMPAGMSGGGPPIALP